jgi:hypothetical protein
MITDCQPDSQRLALFKECMETYDMGEPEAEWPWNVLSRRTVVYSCGAICREGDTSLIHNHDPAEMALCRRLATEAATMLQGVEVGMGSESSDYFAPFFIVASVGATVPTELTEDTIRAVFGGTIYPHAEIIVEPLMEQGNWWAQVETDCGLNEEEDEAEEDIEACLRPWRAMVQWFHTQPALHTASFVMIGEDPLSEENGGCVFPRLALALTEAGSFVGIFGHVVHT